MPSKGGVWPPSATSPVARLSTVRTGGGDILSCASFHSCRNASALCCGARFAMRITLRRSIAGLSIAALEEPFYDEGSKHHRSRRHPDRRRHLCPRSVGPPSCAARRGTLSL